MASLGEWFLRGVPFGLALLAAAALFAVGFLLAHSRARGRNLARLAEAETRARMLAADVDARTQELARVREEVGREREARAAAEARVQEAQKSLDAQRAQFDEARRKLEDAFAALSAAALERNSRVFTEQARRTLEVVLESAKGDLAQGQERMNQLVQPLSDALRRYEEHLREIEKTRSQDYGSLQEHLTALGKAQEQLSRETTGLIGALRGHRVRGRWGEITLRRVVELAGMAEHCDFEEQATADAAGSRLRPDLVVRMPGGRTLAVDAKAPMDAYLDAVEAADESTRVAALARHARNVRDHLKTLTRREYWAQFPESPELVILFLPGESFFAAAVEADPDLIEYGAQNRVIVATPTTLVALLRAIEFGWRQEKAAENAREITRLGQELHKRLRAFAGHLAKMGGALDKAVEAYNSGIGSLERSVMPQARRFAELGAGEGEPVPEIRGVEEPVRRIADPALLPDNEK